jgi:large conductance mechanosensitive channel
MGMIKEFKEFAVKGNAMDMAVGIIIGAAFGKIVSSLVADIIMPPIGYLTGKVDFSTLHFKMPVPDGDPVLIKYGIFINAIIQFIIVAFAVFIMIKQLNKLTAEPVKEEAPTTKDCPECCSSIPIKAKRCPNCTAQI